MTFGTDDGQKTTPGTGATNVPMSEPDRTAWADFKGQLTERRVARLEAAAAHRTNHFRLVIQDVHNDHNVSACLRSAEAFGWAGVDVVTLSAKFRPTTVARGVSEWLRVTKHTSVAECAEGLKTAGFQLIAAVPRTDAVSLPDVDVSRPTAVIFGNEHSGLNQAWDSYIDTWMTIPMVGLVESLNISVAAAVTMFTLTQKSLVNNGARYHYLPAPARADLLDLWSTRMGYTTPTGDSPLPLNGSAPVK